MRRHRVKSKTIKLIIVASCLLFMFLSQTVFAQSDKAKKIDAFIKPFAAANQFSGEVLAAENGRPTPKRTTTTANRASKKSTRM